MIIVAEMQNATECEFNNKMDNIRDPDYEITNLAKQQIRIREEVEKNQCIDRIRSAIKREFQRELEYREKQLELIQRRITKTAKTLHLLRYCLVTSYYNRSELKFNASENDIPLLDSQSRIHPAVKKLLGDNASEIHASLGLRKKRKLHKYSNNTVIQESAETTLKKEATEEAETTSTDSPAESVQNDNMADSNLTSVRNRKLYKHQIVVGNISKWAPSESSDDNSTHKWMVYVRGPKEYPDISHIIEKVTFFLHPSYKPNDVIEVSKSPFHLSRRGWGEFPLRIQLNFHGKMNKPVDVIHNLVLDKTYTGRQTLGNETIVELSLYDLPKRNHSSSSFKINTVTPTMNIKLENEIPEFNEEIETVDNDSIHEQMDISVEIEPPIVNYINLDHSYCQSDTNIKNTKHISSELQDADINEGYENGSCSVVEDAMQCVKKRKPQQSVLKTSVLRKIKVERSDFQEVEL